MLSYRLLPHVARWPELVATLARLAQPGRDRRLPDAAQRQRRRRPLLRPEEGRREGHAAVHGLRRARDRRGASPRNGFRETGRAAAVLLADGAAPRRRARPGSPARSRAPAGALGLTRLLGSPVISLRLRMTVPVSSTPAARRASRDWAVALFRRSVLKQRKLAEVAALLGPTDGPALPRPRLRQRGRQPAAARARRLVGLGRPHRRGRRLDPLAGRRGRAPRRGRSPAVPGRELRPRGRGRHARARAGRRAPSRASWRASPAPAAGW